MMSSEEEAEVLLFGSGPGCSGSSASNIGKNKAKRTRQRVDAGQPRNSYAAALSGYCSIRGNNSAGGVTTPNNSIIGQHSSQYHHHLLNGGSGHLPNYNSVNSANNSAVYPGNNNNFYTQQQSHGLFGATPISNNNVVANQQQSPQQQTSNSGSKMLTDFLSRQMKLECDFRDDDLVSDVKLNGGAPMHFDSLANHQLVPPFNTTNGLTSPVNNNPFNNQTPFQQNCIPISLSTNTSVAIVNNVSSGSPPTSLTTTARRNLTEDVDAANLLRDILQQGNNNNNNRSSNCNSKESPSENTNFVNQQHNSPLPEIKTSTLSNNPCSTPVTLSTSNATIPTSPSNNINLQQSASGLTLKMVKSPVSINDPCSDKDSDSGRESAGGVSRSKLQQNLRAALNGLANNVKEEPLSENLEDDDLNSEQRPKSVNSANHQQQSTEEPLMNGSNSSDNDRSPSPTQVQGSAPSSPLGRGEDSQSAPRDNVELKRARVENIVNFMRSSPSLPTQVNGCKKRKLYHPQQHDSVRYSTLTTLDDDEEDEDEDEISLATPLAATSHQLSFRKMADLETADALKSQLRSMQQQLAAMQEKYVQLYNRVGAVSNDSLDTAMNDDPDDLDVDMPSSTQVIPSSNNPSSTSVPTTVSHGPSSSSQPQIDVELKPTLLPTILPQQLSGATPHSIPTSQHHPLLQHSSGPHPSLPHHPHPHIPHPHHPHMGPGFAGMGGPMHRNPPPHGPPQNQQQTSVKDKMIIGPTSPPKPGQPPNHPHHPHVHPQHHPHHHPQLTLNNGLGPSGNDGNDANFYLDLTRRLLQEQDARLLKDAEAKATELSEKLAFLRGAPLTGADLEGLAEVLKAEIANSLAIVVDSIVARFLHQRRVMGKHVQDAEQLNKDLLVASQLLDRKSPRTKVIDRGNRVNGSAFGPSSGIGMGGNQPPQQPQQGPPGEVGLPGGTERNQGPPNMSGNSGSGISMRNPLNNLPSLYPTSKPLYSNSLMGMAAGHLNHPSLNVKRENNPRDSERPSGTNNQQPTQPPLQQHPSQHTPPGYHEREGIPEQNEALSLVVTPKKKRHKVTDTRITPRTVSRLLGQDNDLPKYISLGPGGLPPNSRDSPSPRPYAPPPPPLLPVSLPTSVAIPNPSLQESQIFSPYGNFYGQHRPSLGTAGTISPPLLDRGRENDSPPMTSHPHSLLHPALLAASTPDYMHMRGGDTGDRNSDCNSGEGTPYDGLQPTISFYARGDFEASSLTSLNSSTLTPMHLRKAKLMFFWVRYPSSAILKMYFPDIKFNKNNTAQLVKWFSNFREFYYIQMEKYARQFLSEGGKTSDEIHVTLESEIYRVLNLHYNRNNHIEVPQNFRNVVEATLREFFKAVQAGKDTEQSWKKSIYKVISRMDDPVPEYFKSPNFLEQLE